MKRFFVLLLILGLFSEGCFSLPFLSKSKHIAGKVKQPEEVSVEINVGIERLWQAAIQEFRKFKIIEAVKEKRSISAVNKGINFEFIAFSKDKTHSVFKVKAYDLSGISDYPFAKRLSSKIYKHAKSVVFSIKQFVGDPVE